MTQGITDGSLGKDFMTIIRLVLFFMVLALASCDEELTDPPIPDADFQDIQINLSLPEYNALNTPRGHLELGNGGIRGIILYNYNGQYLAIEKYCSYQENACGYVQVHTSNLYLTDNCCGSNFSLPEVNPTAGPARSPLRIYETFLSGSTLTITDQSSNGF